MNPHLNLAPRRFPSRIADLGFTATLPADWISHDLPDDEIDFSNPTQFAPLAVLTAPSAAIVFAMAARPAHDDGALFDWAWYHLNHHALQPRAVGQDLVAGVTAVSGEATQASDLGPLVVRFAFLEDGDRLLNLTLTAPELLADAVRDAWFAALKSLSLETPRGSRFAAEAHPDLTPVAPIPEPWLDARPDAGAAAACVLDAESGEPLLRPALQLPLPSPTPKRRFRLFDFALSDDSIALDEDHAINVKLRQQGAGAVPDITGLNDETRTATLAAGAVRSAFDVPYGWHVVDDGQRALVFEPGGQVQIDLSLLPRQGRSDEALLDDIERTLRREHADPAFERPTGRPFPTLQARGLADPAQPLEQVYLLRPFRDHIAVLRARVTAAPTHACIARKLAELILASCQFEPEPLAEADEAPPAAEPDQPPPDGRPRWWHEALALEASNQLDAAEQHIRTNCPFIGFAQATAELYQLRMRRLKAHGDAPGALDAFMKSSDFIWRYASMATSGGEGAALSLERDDFRAQLVAAYGSDPEALHG